MSRLPVGAWPRDRQASLVLRRALTNIEERRTALALDFSTRPEYAPRFYRNWPLGLPDPRWVVALAVHTANRRARSFTVSEDVCAEITDAILVALALDAA